MLGNCFEIYKSTGGEGFALSLSPVGTYSLPTQLVEKGQSRHDEAWYLDNMRYIISFYNTPTNNVNSPTPTNALATSPVSRMQRNLDYVIGEQNWGDFGHIVNETANSQYYFRKNRKIASIVDKLTGAASGKVSQMIIGADPLSSDVKTWRDEKVNVEMYKYLVKPHIEDGKGLKVSPPEDNFQSREDVISWGKDGGLKDHIADTLILIGEHQMKAQRLRNKSDFCFLHALAGGITGLECVVDNGIPQILWHPCYNLIFDNRKDQKYGEESRFVGVVDNMTTTHLFEKYSFLSQEVREDIDKISQTPNLMNQLNIIVPNVSWWTANPTTPPAYKDTSVSVVRCYWISPDDEDPTINTIYTAEVIGNKYMVNYGKCNNVVLQRYSTYQLQLPIITWTPGMVKGNLNALLSRITDLSDEYELYRAKIRQLVQRTKGVVYYISGTESGKNDTEKDLMDDFTDLGVHVFAWTGDPVIDKIDRLNSRNITNDAAIESMIKLNQLVNSEIESFISQTPISMGEQTKYVGSKAFSGSLEQSSLGSSWLYDGLGEYLSIVLRYQTNVVKNLYAAGELSEEAAQVVGDTGIELLKNIKDKFAEHYLIYLCLKDNIPDARKEGIEKLAMQAATQPAIMPYLKYLIKMGKANTYSELENDLNTMADEIQRKEEEQAQANQEASARSQASEQQSQDEQLTKTLQVKQMKGSQDYEIKLRKIQLEQAKLHLQIAELGGGQ